MTNDGYTMEEINRRISLGKASMANLTKIMKDSEFSTNIKDKLVHTIVFPAVLHQCESRMLKKADKRKIDTFNLRMWRRLFGIPGPASTNASVINQRKPKHSGETSATISKLKYFGHIMCM
jgi:hypothetical protein